MAEHATARLLMSEFVTHDVKRFIITRPPDFSFEPGQGVELAIKLPHWENEFRPFTPTSLQDDEVLEFTIKAYPQHEGVTDALHKLAPGVELLLSKPFGTIHYQGPGVFLAGGAGITPFVAILREQARRNKLADSTLIFSNKSSADIIYKKEMRHYLGDHCILTCTQERTAGCEPRRIDKALLAEKINDFAQPFYVCGPPGFMETVNGALRELGADPQNLIFER